MAQSNLSEKGQENLRQMKLWREKNTGGQGQFVSLKSGQTKVLMFDVEDMSTEIVEFDGKKTERAKYGVYDISEGRTDKQYFWGGKMVSMQIDSNLEEGNIVLKISRTGEQFDTKYSVVATQLPPGYKSPY